jgi:carboxypeptidase PM20D1
MFKKAAALLAIALLALLAVLAFNTWRLQSVQPAVQPAPPPALDQTAALERLGAAVRLQTIASADDPKASSAEFLKLHRHLEASFPRIHAALKREVINGHSLLYTWTGSDASAKPILLLAHMDVVPVEASSAGDWQQPGFSGAVAGGYIWGRGTWDNKGNLFSQFEAVEALLAAGFKPRQTIYLASGADEEVGGARGAQAIAALLKQRGVHLDFVLDEGLVLTEGLVPGMAAPVGLIGVAQKGYMTATLSVTLPQAGHAAQPPREGAIGILSAGLARLEAHPFPTRLSGVTLQMFEALAPEMPLAKRVPISNLWLFGPIVKSQLAATDTARALLHTTTALTVLRAGEKENVLPSRAEALVNFRIIPGDTVDGVLARVREVLDDPRIEVRKPPQPLEPSPVASTQSRAYGMLAQSIRQTFPGSVVAPGLLTARADGGFFEAVADNVYLFTPVRMGPDDTGRLHGINERVSVKNYVEMINFYHRLIVNAAS